MDSNSSFIRLKSVRTMATRFSFVMVSIYVALLAIDLIHQVVIGNL